MSPSLSVMGDPARPSGGNVFLWTNVLTPWGDGIIVDGQQDISFVGIDADAPIAELLRHPVGHAPFRNVVDKVVARLRTRLCQRGVLLQLGCDQSQRRLRRRALQIRSDRLRLGRFPLVDVLDDYESPLAAGAADLVYNSSSSVAAGLVKGVKSKCVANGGLGYYGWHMMVKPDSPIKKLSELAGKKVGITSAGSGSDILARWTMADQKLEFTRVPLGGGGLVPASVPTRCSWRFHCSHI